MKQEIKTRIEQIQRGEIPAGYVKNKEGIHPADWESKPIGEWIELCERPTMLQDDKEYQLVTVRRRFGGVDSRGQYKGQEILVKNYFEVREKDFLISKRQAAHGACGVVPEKLNRAVVSNEYSVFVTKEGTNIHTFDMMMQLPHYTRLFYLMSDGVHIEKMLLKTQDWMKRSLAMPPLEGQRKIAEVLSTQDKIINLKEKRIAEKKYQKKYLMQQLFKGKYQENSKKVKLGDISSTFSGGTPDRTHPEYFGGGINWIKSGELNQKNIIRTEETITLEGLVNSSAKMVPRNTLLIAMYGATAGVMAVTKIDAAINQAVLAIIPQIKLNACYLKYAIEIQIDSAVNRLTQGGQPNFNAKIIKSFMIALPQLENQNAIAEILSTADREIELLERDLEQEKQKKKALMQLLLTGIVRISM